MSGEHQRRRRPVTACQACYQKKQRCDRQAPCSNCIRRQQPELCHYSSAAANVKQPATRRTSSASTARKRGSRPISVSPTCQHLTDSNPRFVHQLLDKFGFSSLVKLESHDIPPALLAPLQECFKLYPKRSITDTLMRSFFENIRWSGPELDEVLFAKVYKDWWSHAPEQRLERVLFGVLVLRACSIGSAFLPPGDPIEERILEIGVSTVAIHCDKLANRIQGLIKGLPGTNSLIYVKIVYMTAVYNAIQGQLETAWYTLNNAIRVIQDIGSDLDSPNAQGKEGTSLEAQPRHSTFLNVLIMDSILCFFLDRPPTMSERHFTELQLARDVCRIKQTPESEPGPYSERILQAQLWQIWTAMQEGSGTLSKFRIDPPEVEQRRRRLSSFIEQLPSAFNMDLPDKQWDHRVPTLEYQRHWLHINILMVQCGILQHSLLHDQLEVAKMSEGEKSMTRQHLKLLASSTSTLQDVLSNVRTLSDSTGGTISILRPFAVRSAILAGLSFIRIRSTHVDTSGSRSWPDCHQEDSMCVDRCRQQIQDTVASLTNSQSDPAAETETRILHAILASIEDLSAGGVNSNATVNDLNSVQFIEHSWIGGTLGSLSNSSSFPPMLSPGSLDTIAAFTGPQLANASQGAQNNDVWNSTYFPTFFDPTYSNGVIPGAGIASRIDQFAQFHMPIFSPETASSSGVHNWERSCGPVVTDTAPLDGHGSLFD